MKYSQEIIQRIKDRVKVSDILARQVAIIPAGHMRYKALCPFHNEKTPSFIISDDKQTYHCFGCGAHGDIISFLMEKENYNFTDAIEELAKLAGINLPKQNYDEKKMQENAEDYQIINSFQSFFRHNFINSEADSYIRNRGISSDNILKFAIGYAPKRTEIENFVRSKSYSYEKLVELGLYRLGKNGYYFLFSDRLIFPILNHSGKLVAFGGRSLTQSLPKYINSPEYKFFKKRELLYNFYQAKAYIQKAKEVILCEGYMDVIAMQQAGFYNVVAPLGTAFSEYHLDSLWYYCDNPTICLDGDVAGRKAMSRIADIAIAKLKPGKTVSFVLLPEGKDPDDIIKTEGVESMKLLLHNKFYLAEIILKEHCHEGLVTPEARSAAQEKLNNIAYKIQHEAVRSEYLRYFKDEFFKFFRNKSYYSKSKLTGNLRVNIANFKIEELEFLSFIAANINILHDDECEEYFSLIDFENINFSKIQKFLLENSENFNLAKLIEWLNQNVAKECLSPMIKKIKFYDNVRLAEAEQRKHFDYHHKTIILSRLRQDYQNNMRSGEESKQKLAIQLKHDIKLLENELNQHLTG